MEVQSSQWRDAGLSPRLNLSFGATKRYKQRNPPLTDIVRVVHFFDEDKALGAIKQEKIKKRRKTNAQPMNGAPAFPRGAQNPRAYQPRMHRMRGTTVPTSVYAMNATHAA
jgi:hypothetical protein